MAAKRTRKSPAKRKASAKAKRKGKAAAPAAPVSDVGLAAEDRNLEIVWRPVGQLRPSRNARTHSDSQLELLAGSLRTFGWMNPILTDEKGRILAGHGRWAAAKMLGLARVPTLPHDGMSAREKRAYVLADNRLAELAGWDVEILASELGALKKTGLDLGVLGWSPDQVTQAIAAATARAGRTGLDDAPPAPSVATTRLGDVWVLGQHRVLCGDATVPAQVRGLLEGRLAPFLMVTDPPYGVSYDPKWREEAGLAGDGSAKGAVMNDDRADWREAWALFPGSVAYVWHAGTKQHLVAESLAASGFEVRAQIIWVKSRFAVSRGAYHHQHEPAFYAARDGLEDDRWQETGEAADPAAGLSPIERFNLDHEQLLYSVREKETAHWAGGRKQSTVWNIDHLKNDTGHGTQKPVECMRRPIENNSAPGDAVYDPFLGSGTTLIAAENTGRVCYGLELDPAYCDVIVKRWQAFTGSDAVLEGSGATFDEADEERAGG